MFFSTFILNAQEYNIKKSYIFGNFQNKLKKESSIVGLKLNPAQEDYKGSIKIEFLNIKTAKRYYIELITNDTSKCVFPICIEPGKYKLNYIHLGENKKKFSVYCEGIECTIFKLLEVLPGNIYYIGDFIGEVSIISKNYIVESNTKYNYQLKKIEDNYSFTMSKFIELFPSFDYSDKFFSVFNN